MEVRYKYKLWLFNAAKNIISVTSDGQFYCLGRYIEYNAGEVQDRAISDTLWCRRFPYLVCRRFPYLVLFRWMILFIIKHLIILFTFHRAFSFLIIFHCWNKLSIYRYTSVSWQSWPKKKKTRNIYVKYGAWRSGKLSVKWENIYCLVRRVCRYQRGSQKP